MIEFNFNEELECEKMVGYEVKCILSSYEKEPIHKSGNYTFSFPTINEYSLVNDIM